MTLEEAIKHCEEKAKELEKKVKPYQCESINKKLYEVNKKEWDSCLECAKEHRQLAEWLRELKDYREHEFCRYCEERDTIIFDEPCKSCKIRFVRKKVNADEDSD